MSDQKDQPRRVTVPHLLADASVVLFGAVDFLLVAGFTTFLQPLTAALLTGSALALALRGGLKRRVATAGMTALIGAAAAVLLFNPVRWERLIRRQPAYMLLDRPVWFIERFLMPLARHAMAAPFMSRAGHVLYIVTAVALTTATAAGVSLMLRMRATRVIRAAVACAALGVLSLAFGWTLFTVGAPFLDHTSREAKPYTYGYDALIYERTFWVMRSGADYYPALVEAAAGDTRLRTEHSVVGGKFRSWAISPLQLKQGWIQYFWQLLGSKASSVVTFSALLCMTALFACYFALRRFVGDRALLVAVFAFPILLMNTAADGVFFPDWWAGLALLFSVFALLRRRWVAAGLFALAAALCRDVAAVWLVLLLSVAVAHAIRSRQRKWVARAAAFALFLAVFAGAFALHAHLSDAVIAAPQYRAASPTALSMLSSSASRPLGRRFATPGSFAAFPYGLGLIPPFLMLFAQLPGFWFALRQNRAVRGGVLAFALFWLLFTLTIGAASGYWGQEYVPVAVLGTGLLLASTDRITLEIANVHRPMRAGRQRRSGEALHRGSC